MKVVGVVEYGGPEALRVFDVPEPHAGRGQARIRVRAAAVNPTDTLVRNGSRAESQKEFEPPFVPGVLDEIGDGVSTELAIGDQVMAIVVPRGSHGGYAEHVVVPIESVVRTRLALALLGLQPGGRPAQSRRSLDGRRPARDPGGRARDGHSQLLPARAA